MPVADEELEERQSTLRRMRWYPAACNRESMIALQQEMAAVDDPPRDQLYYFAKIQDIPLAAFQKHRNFEPAWLESPETHILEISDFLGLWGEYALPAEVDGPGHIVFFPEKVLQDANISLPPWNMRAPDFGATGHAISS